MSETRKLAAILAADVVGYSRLAGADEDRTLARLRALRSTGSQTWRTLERLQSSTKTGRRVGRTWPRSLSRSAVLEPMARGPEG